MRTLKLLIPAVAFIASSAFASPRPRAPVVEHSSDQRVVAKVVDLVERHDTGGAEIVARDTAWMGHGMEAPEAHVNAKFAAISGDLKYFLRFSGDSVPGAVAKDLGAAFGVGQPGQIDRNLEKVASSLGERVELGVRYPGEDHETLTRGIRVGLGDGREQMQILAVDRAGNYQVWTPGFKGAGAPSVRVTKVLASPSSRALADWQSFAEGR